jgi:Mg-chelatase subunit ChlD
MPRTKPSIASIFFLILIGKARKCAHTSNTSLRIAHLLSVAATCLLLDVSASMHRKAGTTRLLELAVRSLVHFVEQLEQQQLQESLAVIKFSGEAELLQSFTNNYSRVKSALRAITEVETRTDTAKAVSLAISLLAEFDSSLPSNIIILTDGRCARCALHTAHCTLRFCTFTVALMLFQGLFVMLSCRTSSQEKFTWLR